MHGLKQTKKLLRNIQSARLLKKTATPLSRSFNSFFCTLKVISRLTYKMGGMLVIKTKKIKKPPSKIGGRKISKTFCIPL